MLFYKRQRRTFFRTARPHQDGVSLMPGYTADTIGYYERNAEKFIRDTASADMRSVREAFLAYIPEGGRILQKGVYAYARQLEGKTVLVFLNGTSKQQTIDLTPYQEVIPSNKAYDVLTHKYINLEKELSFNPREIFVLDFGVN